MHQILTMSSDEYWHFSLRSGMLLRARFSVRIVWKRSGCSALIQMGLNHDVEHYLVYHEVWGRKGRGCCLKVCSIIISLSFFLYLCFLDFEGWLPYWSFHGPRAVVAFAVDAFFGSGLTFPECVFHAGTFRAYLEVLEC